MRKSTINLLLLAVTMLLCPTPAVARYCTQILQPNIKTLRIQYLNNTVLQRPFLTLDNGLIDGSDDANTLEISFDEMSHETHQYTYSLVHLNADMQPSDLQSYDFVDGFTTQDITDYEHSGNTQRNYTHYRFTFPNEDMILKASGNYAIKIYEDGNPDKIVAIACFCVVDAKVGIETHVKSNTEIEFNGRYQQLDIDINTIGLNIRDPHDITLVVRQNNRHDNEVHITQPTYLEGTRLRYYNQRELIFEGGNEYRHFDNYSIYFAGTNIDRVIYDRNDYHAILFTDENRTQSAYTYEPDANGQFIIHAERTSNSDTEAEYMWVHWTLPMERPLLNGRIYVGGEMFFNQLNSDNLMQYDADNKCYWLTSLVKQGGHDYQYWYTNNGSKKATLQPIEGSHWETKNEYSVYVYYRPFGCRYDQLIGLVIVH